MTLSKFLDPKNDFAFKRIFGTEKNVHILIQFLNDILGSHLEQPIKEVTFLKTSQDPEIASKKQSIVDVLCKDEKGTQYIIEMQVATTDGFEKRAQYYAAKAYVNQMNNGEAYQNLKEIIFLAIVNFVMFPKKKEFKSDHFVLDTLTHQHDLKDFSFCFLELPKFDKSIEKLETPVERWTYFFKHASETKESDLERISGNDLAIKEAYEQLNQFSWSEIELRTYEQEKKRERDAQAILSAARKEGLQEGKKEGLQEGMKKIAKALLADGMSPDKISTLTGLKREEILVLSSQETINFL